MSISVARIRHGDHTRWAMLTDGRLQLLGVSGEKTADLFAFSPTSLKALATETTIDVADAEFLSPVTRPTEIVCQGLNYSDHAMESGHRARQHNLLFGKASSSLSGAFAPVIRPPGCQTLDYEVELGLVLKRGLTSGDIVTRETLGQWIGGLVICNDISARDVMFGAAYLQWYRGKSFRTFCPCGPFLLIPEPSEVADLLDRLELKLWLNDELRQHAWTRDMIFRPETTLTEIAQVMDLAPGDLLLTGTPGGVIAQASPAAAQILSTRLFADGERQQLLVEEALGRARYLQPGDTIRARIASDDGSIDLGTQSFHIADQPAR